MESSSTTRIMDLPDNFSMNPMGSGGGQYAQNPNLGKVPSFPNTTSYAPIDVHPNPYGHPPPSVPMFPTPSFNGGNGGGYVPPPPSQIQHRVPSRDIPIDQSEYMQDEQVQPNYIPPVPPSAAKLTAQYMEEYEKNIEKEIQTHGEKKKKESRIEQIIEQSQIPILVGILFFIFHIPIVNQNIFRHFSFLSLNYEDGGFNLYGLLLKSVLFGITFFVFTQIIHFMADL